MLDCTAVVDPKRGTARQHSLYDTNIGRHSAGLTMLASQAETP